MRNLFICALTCAALFYSQTSSAGFAESIGETLCWGQTEGLQVSLAGRLSSDCESLLKTPHHAEIQGELGIVFFDLVKKEVLASAAPLSHFLVKGTYQSRALREANGAGKSDLLSVQSIGITPPVKFWKMWRLPEHHELFSSLIGEFKAKQAFVEFPHPVTGEVTTVELTCQ